MITDSTKFEIKYQDVCFKVVHKNAENSNNGQKSKGYRETISL